MSVYFAKDSKNGWIKIGCSKDPEKRIKSIPTDKGHMVDNLKLLKVIDGSFDEESFCQRLLARHSVHEKSFFSKEWFYPTDEVVSLAEKPVSWFVELFEKCREIDREYGYSVKYSFNGSSVVAKVG